MKYWTFFLAIVAITINISACCSPCEEEDCEEVVEEATCSVFLSYEGMSDRYYFCIRGVPEACAVTFSETPSSWYDLSRCGEEGELGHCILLNNRPLHRIHVFDELNRTVDLLSCEFHPDEEIWWEEDEYEVRIDFTP